MRILSNFLNQTSTLGRKLTAIAALAALAAVGIGPIEAHATVPTEGDHSCSTSGEFTITYESDQIVARDLDRDCAGTAVIPDGVTYIGYFQYGASLVAIEIPASVTEIQSYAFSQCTSLTTFTIAANSRLTSIPEELFGNTRLASFTVPASVTSIGNTAFANLSTLTSLTFEPNSQLETIQAGAFRRTGLTSVTLPRSLVTLRNEAFLGSTSLASVSFEAGSRLTTLGDEVFSGLPQSTIALPDTVSTLGRGPFASNLRLTISESNPNLSMENNVIFNKNKTILVAYAPWLTDATYVIPASVTELAPFAFEDSQLQTLNIPTTVSTLGRYAFSRTRQLTALTFSPNTAVTTIPLAAFQESRLEQISIPANITSIAGYAFESSRLSQVTFAPNSALVEISENAFSRTRLTSIEIPASVHTIGSQVFRFNAQLTDVSFANGSNLRELGAYALGGTAVTSLTLPTAPTRSGYTFLGWANSQDGSVISSPAASAIDSQALYAQWSTTVTFNSTSGSAVANGAFARGEAVTEPTPPTRAGYTFAGWSLTDGGDAITFPYQPSSSAPLTLYALWLSTVTFNSTSGSAVADGSFARGGTVDAPIAPTRTGFSFTGWSLTEGGDPITFPYQPSSPESFTLFALWEADAPPAPAEPTIAVGSSPDSQVATIPAGLTAAVIPATAALPRVSLSFAALSGSATATVAPISNPAATSATPFTITGTTKIVDIQVTGVTGPVTVCLDGASTDEIFHFTGGAWVALPQRTYANGQVCGVTESFSPFAAAQAVVAPSGGSAVVEPAPYTGPLLSGRSPRTASTIGDSNVTLNGERMAQVTAVLLEGKPLEIVSKSESQIVIKAPAHAVGLVDLVLKSESTSITFQDAFEYKAPVAIRVPVTISKSVAISSASAKSLTASQQKSVTAFVASAPAGAVLKCAATYVSKSEVAAAKALATAACAKAKKANAYIITRVSAPVLVKSKAPRKVLLSLTN